MTLLLCFLSYCWTYSQSGVLNLIGQVNTTENALDRSKQYAWSSLFYSPYGYDRRHDELRLNKFSVKNPFDQRVVWSSISGLNEAMRNRVNQQWGNSEFYNVYNAKNIELWPSELRRQFSVTSSLSSGAYRYRLLLHYNRLLGNKSILCSGSFRYADQNNIEGSPYMGTAGMCSYEKPMGEGRFNFTAIYTRVKKNQSSAMTRELYELNGLNYNPNWGYLQGRRMLGKLREEENFQVLMNYQSPKIYLGMRWHHYTYSQSRVSNHSGSSPYPSYYQNLPSYALERQQAALALFLQDQWKSGEIKQMNFDHFYNSNYGKEAAVYFEKADVKELNLFQGLFTWTPDNFFIRLQLWMATQDNYGELKDLYGAQGFLDIDSFQDGEERWNDLETKEALKDVGDKIEYYNKQRNYGTVVDLVYDFNQPYFNVSVLSQIEISKFGQQPVFKTSRVSEEELEPRDSPLIILPRIVLKGMWKKWPRHILGAYVSYETFSPLSDELFLNSRRSSSYNTFYRPSSGLKGGFEYYYNGESLRIFLRGLSLVERNINKSSVYYSQGLLSGQDLLVQEYGYGFNRSFKGVEFSGSYPLSESWKVEAFGSMGWGVYSKNGFIELKDGTGKLVSRGELYLQGLKNTSGPQKGLGSLISFRSSDYFWMELSGHYLWERGVGLSFLKNSELYYQSFDGKLDGRESYVQGSQERLKDVFLLNLVLGKSFLINDNYYALFVSLQNLLNVHYASGGYESSRYGNVQGEASLFNTQYWFKGGLSYFVNFKVSI